MSALALLALAPRLAQADPSAPASAAKVAPTPKRPVPDYDGRGPAPAPPRDGLLWVPRILLSPLYVVSEYVLREPLAALIPAAERADVPTKLYDFFAFGKDHKAGIVPVGYAEFGLTPSLGLYGFWNDAFAKDNNWSLHAEGWPTDWYAVSLKESLRLDDQRSLHIRVSGSHRPDRVFYGIGAQSLQSSQSRYTEALADESVTLDWRYLKEPSAPGAPASIAGAGDGTGSWLQITMGLRSESVGPGAWDTDPSLEQEAKTGAFAIPYEYDGRYTAEYNGILAAYDSRKPWPAPGSGARVEIEGEQGSDMIGASGWLRYGGTASGFLDLNQHQRVINLSISAQFADPLGDRPVPFTELASLGGDGPMRGYLPRRLVDRSATSAALHYVWPIGPWLGGNIEAAVGNVFGEHLQGFRPELLRFSADIGVTSVGVSDYPIEAIVGIGSETFEHGGQIDSVRAALSVNHGF
jgi:hypothetical protein